MTLENNDSYPINIQNFISAINEGQPVSDISAILQRIEENNESQYLLERTHTPGFTVIQCSILDMAALKAISNNNTDLLELFLSQYKGLFNEDYFSHLAKIIIPTLVINLNAPKLKTQHMSYRSLFSS